MNLNETDLKTVIRILLDTVRNTPGGFAELGRQTIYYPEILKVLEKLSDD